MLAKDRGVGDGALGRHAPRATGGSRPIACQRLIVRGDAVSGLIQLIYRSTAAAAFGSGDLERLLASAREANGRQGITGILLYSDGTFFQVLEGEAAAVDALFARIAKDPRHLGIVTIIREPIARRAFADWTMGCAVLDAADVGGIVGMNDFFGAGSAFAALGPGRAKKLLAAFKEGHWRGKLDGREEAPALRPAPRASVASTAFSFAFQPILDVAGGTIASYEALVRGVDGEPAAQVLQRVGAEDRHGFDEVIRRSAVELACRLGLACDLHLNFLPLSVETSRTSISSTLEAAARCGLAPSRIVLEVLESEIISDYDGFVRAVNAHRALGLRTAIDDFGAGYAGLNLLAEFLPDAIKLDRNLIHQVECKGPRQAIIRGVLGTCRALGIDVIAEGVESKAEFAWLREAGITLFQGNLFAEPAFERLPPARFPPA